MSMPSTTGDVDHSRGPESLAPRTSLTNRIAIVWLRGKAEINNLLGNAPPETHTTHESTRRFPYDIMEMIITHLIGDLRTLKACSLTCRSWYIATVPHLHYVLTLRDTRPEKTLQRLKPLSKLRSPGLNTRVKGIRVREGPGPHPWFVPQAFSRSDLRHFSAFANVQTLVLEFVHLYRFIPDVERYFGHFSQTLRSIAMHDIYCTPRQLSHFLSLFSNLDDIKIQYVSHRPSITAIPDTELIPFSAPRLQGRLELYDFPWIGACADLITSCGLRFRYMDLRRVGGCVPILLEACAETLETLRFGLTEGSGGYHTLSLLPEFNLSQLKVLQSLQVRMWATYTNLTGRHAFVREAFLSITSPAFSELVIVIDDEDIPHLNLDFTLFRTLSTMNKVKSFKLVFLAEVMDPHRDGGMEGVLQSLAGALGSVAAAGWLNFLDSPPAIHATRLPELRLRSTFD